MFGHRRLQGLHPRQGYQDREADNHSESQARRTHRMHAKGCPQPLRRQAGSLGPWDSHVAHRSLASETSYTPSS